MFLSHKIGNGKFIKEKWGSEVEEWHIPREKSVKMLEGSGFKIEDEKLNESENGNDFISFVCVKPKESR